MRQALEVDQEEQEGSGAVTHVNVDVRGMEPRTAAPPSFALTRRQLVGGGWSALLGLAYVAGSRDQGSYRDRKRRLFGSITADGEEFR